CRCRRRGSELRVSGQGNVRRKVHLGMRSLNFQSWWNDAATVDDVQHIGKHQQRILDVVYDVEGVGILAERETLRISELRDSSWPNRGDQSSGVDKAQGRIRIGERLEDLDAVGGRIRDKQQVLFKAGRSD